MKKLILSVMLTAFAVALNAGEAKAGADKAPCCAKSTADAKAVCPMSKEAKDAKAACPMAGKDAKATAAVKQPLQSPKVASSGK